jgi:uncharacterized protein (TIGR01777 family)
MKITLTGASGFIGGPLVDLLRREGHELTVLGRRDPRIGRFFRWDSIADAVPVEAVDGAGAVIHMAGEPVAQRWNTEVKQRIRDSRVKGTDALVRAIEGSKVRPRVLVAASAIGFYGDRGEEPVNEDSRAGSGFLPDVCAEWESSAMKAEKLGVRVAMPRIGIVLHHSGGALQTMLPPFRMGVGGPIGSGQQWMSWIHRDDLVDMIHWCLMDDSISGPVNAVSPTPCRNVDFSKALGRVLSRPAFFPVPGLALKILYGEMASVVLSSQRVLPAVACGKGFQFQYPELDLALRAAIE